jgi:hypothetical protein
MIQEAKQFEQIRQGVIQVKLLGEVISWNVKQSRSGIPFQQVVDALKQAKLDTAVARELAPRNAFSRACRVLKEERIIRIVTDSKDEIEFQFTREKQDPSSKMFDYQLETTLVLEKQTGKVSCNVSQLETEA